MTLDPEEIPLNVKVILMGEPIIYYLLSYYDAEFAEKHDDVVEGQPSKAVRAGDQAEQRAEPAGAEQQLAHAGPGEDGFGDDREGDHRAELEAQDKPGLAMLSVAVRRVQKLVMATAEHPFAAR